MQQPSQSNLPEYKSPLAALLWSLALPGFGQVYNGQTILGIIFMVWELLANVLSGLNKAIMVSFHGEFIKAHDLINYEWGMFYPSIWLFSMWQAYNKALTINSHISGRQNKEAKLTGLFFGATLGMNLGIYWHISPKHLNIRLLSFIHSPVFFGLLLGGLFGVFGHLIEKGIQKNHVRST